MPSLSIAGLLARRAQYVGVDAGTPVGLAPAGVTATNNIERVLAIESDVVCYMLLIKGEPSLRCVFEQARLFSGRDAQEHTDHDMICTARMLLAQSPTGATPRRALRRFTTYR